MMNKPDLTIYDTKNMDNDGSDIQYITDDTQWFYNTTGAYTWYNDNMSYEAEYGALYNSAAFVSGKLCPVGWHVPTNDD